MYNMPMHRRLFKVRKHLGLTQQQIAAILGIGQNAYSMIENGRIQLTERNRSILAERLYINPVFLTEGIGEMMLAATPSDVQTHQNSSGQWVVSGGTKSLKTQNSAAVPYYSKQVTGSMLISYDDLAREEPEYYIDLAPLNDCTFYRPVFGESMSPRYNPGDLVACKRVRNRNIILYGESYLCMISLDGDFYETIKILRRNATPGMITLMPCNAAFDQTDVPIDAIKDLYLIKGKIERNI